MNTWFCPVSEQSRKREEAGEECVYTFGDN